MSKKYHTKRKYRLWMKVTNDIYEFPLVVACSQGELAKMLGCTPNNIASSISHARRRDQTTPFRYVDVSKKEWEELRNLCE